MIKFVYIALLVILSFFLFIFSKDKEEKALCHNKISGKVEMIQDSSLRFIGIITQENKIFYPSSIANQVVLAVGKKVEICYTVDSSFYQPDTHFIPIYIRSVHYYEE